MRKPPKTKVRTKRLHRRFAEMIKEVAELSREFRELEKPFDPDEDEDEPLKKMTSLQKADEYIGRLRNLTHDQRMVEMVHVADKANAANVLHDIDLAEMYHHVFSWLFLICRHHEDEKMTERPLLSNPFK
jgi:hypothetical protein